ncbi:MAG: glycoside hydrolase family protein [Planctomycetota bacterium]|jgi:hypothetical protein
MREKKISDFCKGLAPVGRILEDPDHYVWGCSPIYGPDGRIHVFYSKWPNAAGFGGWLNCCVIGHAVADTPEGPYEILDNALEGRGGDGWDSMTNHNPTIHKVGDTYALFYLGNCDGTVYTKRVGVAVSDSLDGPWKKSDAPIVLPSENRDAWDSICTTNPAFLQHPNGQYWLYYKGWNVNDWEYDLQIRAQNPNPADEILHTNRAYGLAVAENIEGPYIKCDKNPVINVRTYGAGMQCEDGYIYIDNGKFKMIMRDMGFYNHEYGLMFESDDGIRWSDPVISFYHSHEYFKELPKGLDREGRFERPQLLMKDGNPRYLFCAIVGGQYMTSSGIVLKINDF